jgi:hypothetical protein
MVAPARVAVTVEARCAGAPRGGVLDGRADRACEDLPGLRCRQIKQRSQASCSRTGSCRSDPDARPIRKGKLGKPNLCRYRDYPLPYAETVFELAVTENTKRGARGLILPAASAIGNPQENALLPNTVAQLKRLGISPREVALDGGFSPARRTRRGRAGGPPRSLAAKNPAPSAPAAGLARYRTGEEGRDQPPQTRLRAGPHPPEGQRRSVDVDRMEHPRLQR